MRKSLAVAAMLLASSALAGELTLKPLPQRPGMEKLPVVPWVTKGDTGWKSGKPTFEIADPKSETAATGYLAMTDEAFLLHIIVTDSKHTNDKTGDAIWQGDSIQFSIDASGSALNAHTFPPGTAAYGFALTDNGPAGWVYSSGTPLHVGATKTPLQVARNDEAQTTTYDIAIPWSDLLGSAGLSPTIGLVLQINDSDGGIEQNRIFYGEETKDRPEGYGRLAVGVPPGALAASGVLNSSIWRAQDAGEILFAVAGDQPLTVSAAMGEQTAEFSIPPGAAGEGIRRYVVSGCPGSLPAEPIAFRASLKDATGAVLTQQETKLQWEAKVFEQLNRRIDELAADSPHPLFTRHLRSVQALANCEWQMANLSLDKSSATAHNAVRNVKSILRGLEGDAAKWDTYRNRQRKMIISFVAKDRSIQFYHLLLPKNWEPQKTYPMVVYLHGAGTSDVALDNVVAPFLGDLESQPPTARFDGELDMVYIEPFARGRSWYVEYAADDVLRSTDDACKTLQIDPDRVYLTGFSMGGMGTWGLMLRTPDRWAVAVVNAGSTRNAAVGAGLGRNALGLPVRISHGEVDRAVPVSEAYKMAEELRQCGSEPELIVLPGVGHEYYGKPWEAANLQWMLSHKRVRPDRFAFVADLDGYTGRNGVTMRRDPRVSPLPSFECTIKGQQVTLTSEGTERIDVNLGEGGLGLTGDVSVTWNGKLSYEGPVKRITLAEGDADAAK